MRVSESRDRAVYDTYTDTDWPKCAVPACGNRSCRSLGSKYCWPHTPGTPGQARDNLEQTGEARPSARPYVFLALLAVLLLVASCGGGGDDGQRQRDQPRSTIQAGGSRP